MSVRDCGLHVLRIDEHERQTDRVSKPRRMILSVLLRPKATLLIEPLDIRPGRGNSSNLATRNVEVLDQAYFERVAKVALAYLR